MEDNAATIRRARFGKLPERVRYDELVEERPATPQDPARFDYDADVTRRTLACLALDLGL